MQLFLNYAISLQFSVPSVVKNIPIPYLLNPPKLPLRLHKVPLHLGSSSSCRMRSFSYSSRAFTLAVS